MTSRSVHRGGGKRGIGAKKIREGEGGGRKGKKGETCRKQEENRPKYYYFTFNPLLTNSEYQ